MKKNITYLLFIVLAFICFNKDIYAATAEIGIVGQHDTSLVNRLKTEYDKGLPTINVSNSQEILVYGKSECSTSSGSCSYSYQGVNSGQVEELLKRAVRCSGGQTNITYIQVLSQASDYKADYSGSADITAYWSETYNVTCVSSSTDDSVILSGTSSSGESGTGSTTGSSSAGATTGSTAGSTAGSSSTGQTTTQQYSSSTTETSPETGVETYYLVLGIVAILSYVFMIVVKKYNLFKNI